MNKLYYIIALILSGASFVNCAETSSTKYDDRIVENPSLDSIMNIMISNCRYKSDLHRNPDFDSTIYFVTFDIFSMNDTDRVIAMGTYQTPFIFHDSIGHGMDHFVGYFKRQDVYCFVYESLFDSLTENLGKIKRSSIAEKFIRDWRLRKQSENPDFFLYDISGRNVDPYNFEYMIDSAANCTLLRKGYW